MGIIISNLLQKPSKKQEVIFSNSHLPIFWIQDRKLKKKKKFFPVDLSVFVSIPGTTLGAKGGDEQRRHVPKSSASSWGDRHVNKTNEVS